LATFFATFFLATFFTTFFLAAFFLAGTGNHLHSYVSAHKMFITILIPIVQ
jgi:hypothetical protein